MIRAIAIEDSELARIELSNLIARLPNVELIGEAENGIKAIELINKMGPDLIFLDIHLPDMDGFEMLNEIDVIPRIIFTTAYDEYAIKSFDFNTVDYLLKPIKADRLKMAIDKVRIETAEKERFSLEHKIFIKDNQQYHITFLKDVALFHTEGSYTKVYFKEESPLLHKSLSQIELGLDKRFFFRINRQEIVNINHIVKVDTWFKGKLKLSLSCGIEVEVSERQSVKLKQKLSF